jgi:hypothetical protein
LPALTVTRASPSQGTIDAAAAAWDPGPIAPGATATLDVTATVTRPVQIQISLQRVRSAPPDGNTGNDRATLSIDAVPPGGGGRYIALGNTDGGPRGEVVVGGGQIESPQVQIYDANGALELGFYAFDQRFRGGVRLAVCDFDGDGRDEIVAGAGTPGGGPHVRVFSRRPTGANERASWYTVDPDNRGGVYVACGDLDGDGVPEVVTGTGAQGPALIQVWKLDISTGAGGEVARRIVPELPPDIGLRVAVCDATGDGRAEILATPAGGGFPIVGVFDASTLALLRTFRAALPSEAQGLQIACGDVLPGGGNEVIVGLDPGGSPIARAFRTDGTLLGEYLAFAPTPGGGVRVAVGEFDGDPAQREFALASGLNAAPQALVGAARGGAVTILLRLAPLEVQ